MRASSTVLARILAVALGLLWAGVLPSTADVLLTWNGSPDFGLTPGTPVLAEGVAGGAISKGSGCGYKAWSSGAAIVGVSAVNSSSLTLNDYLEFTVAPAAGKRLKLEALELNTRVQSAVDPKFTVRSSLDGFTLNLIEPFGQAVVSIDLSSPAFAAITEPITFRIYTWNASGAGAQHGLRSQTDASSQLLGTVESAAGPTLISLK